jgi:hypothetical protein
VVFVDELFKGDWENGVKIEKEPIGFEKRMKKGFFFVFFEFSYGNFTNFKLNFDLRRGVN